MLFLLLESSLPDAMRKVVLSWVFPEDQGAADTAEDKTLEVHMHQGVAEGLPEHPRRTEARRNLVEAVQKQKNTLVVNIDI